MLAAALTVTEQPLRLLLLLSMMLLLVSSHKRPPKTEDDAEEAGEEDDRKVFLPFLGSERKQLVVTERLSTGRGRAPLVEVLSEVGSLNILLTRASRIKEGGRGKTRKEKKKEQRRNAG